MERELDLEEIARRASRAAGAVVSTLRPLTGGLSSITLVGTLGDSGRRIVIKVAPPGLAPVRNRDVLRQARILRLLAGIDGVAVPEVLFEDEGQPPLFGMAFVEGESYEPVTSGVALPEPGRLRDRGWAAARMLAHLHGVDPGSGAMGASEPSLDLGAEVDRWERALTTLDGDLSWGCARCAAALRATIPAPVAPALLHGDWRLGNMICVDGGIHAVIDWEIWSVGDPRVDLSWFLANSVSTGNVFATREAPGLPDRDALLAAYEDERGALAGDLGWFESFTAFKQAATMGLIIKHNRRRPQPDPAIEGNAVLIHDLLDSAHNGLGEGAVHRGA